MESADPAMVTNLSYLREFCEGEEDRIKMYISIYLKAIPAFEKDLNKAVATMDRDEITALMHSFKPKWMMMGMNGANDLGQQIEMLCSEAGNEEKIAGSVSELIELNRRSVAELERIV